MARMKLYPEEPNEVEDKKETPAQEAAEEASELPTRPEQRPSAKLLKPENLPPKSGANKKLKPETKAPSKAVDVLHMKHALRRKALMSKVGLD